MKNKTHRVAIILVCTNEKHFLKECLDSLFQQTFSDFKIFLVDNNSSDGSVSFVKRHYPKVEIIENGKNLGFAAANNVGMKNAFEKGFDLCFLLNPDTRSDKKMLENLVKTYISKGKNHKIGMVQPLLLLYDKPQLINSAGNPIHFLGFGYAGHYLDNKASIKSDVEVLSATGGATLITKDLFLKTGGLDEAFFMYCEDQNLSWQGGIYGFRHYLSAKAFVYHKYRFNRNKKKLFFAERNRLVMLLENYSIKTLLLLAPIILLNEILMLLYSLFNGWLPLKLKSYFSLIINLKQIIAKRKFIQKERTVKDKDIFIKMSCKLNFRLITNSFLFRPVNYLYCSYFRLIKNLI